MSTEQSARLKTAHRLLAAYSSLDVGAILSNLSSDFTHQVLPASLGMPTRDKASFAAHAGGITSVFSKFDMNPQMVLEDGKENAVVVYCKMVGEMRPQKGGGEWANECMMVMRMSEDGERVVQVREFVDSYKAMQMRSQVKPEDF
ncbi:hypothetical protein LTR66_014665 [Elasticomyces elasticus]|nr:hypothetical protein LTR66_014665 [Elasticomyces elasticus]KAK4986247.1 hypothetical protein LTR50_005426 [Elasticomyces elasticus]